jgi:hypothetical protein
VDAVRRDELHELHYITLIDTVPSICEFGILSHRRAESVPHDGTVAMPEIQEVRAKKVVPGGRPLHEYANLYVCARNPMLFKRQDQHAELCVLRVSPEVLDLPGVVVTDSNARSYYARFAPAPSGLSIVDGDLTLAESWAHPDQIRHWRHSAAKAAEVLVPDVVPASLLMGAYVSCQSSLDAFRLLGVCLVVAVDGHLFFRS